MIHTLLQAPLMAAEMGWLILWPLILGFFLSGVIQAVVSHSEMAGRPLDDPDGRRLPRRHGVPVRLDQSGGRVGPGAGGDPRLALYGGDLGRRGGDDPDPGRAAADLREAPADRGGDVPGPEGSGRPDGRSRGDGYVGDRGAAAEASDL